jgi:hypothetical protein
MLLTWLVAGSVISAVVSPPSAAAQPPDARADARPLVQFLEARVPDELVIDGIVLAQHDLRITIEQVGDTLVVSLIALPAGRVVASTKIDAPPAEREASLAVVTQVTATLYGQYAGTFGPAPDVYASPRIAPPTRVPRSGLTFDLEFGAARPGGISVSGLELGLGIGVGAWIFPGKLALTGRFAMSTVDQGQTAVNASYVSNEFLGASLQYWIDDHFWISGGPGFVAFSASQTYDSILPTRSACTPDCMGVGLDLRAGYAIGEGAHQLEISAEAISGYYSNDPNVALHVPYETSSSGPGTTTSLLALIGYHFL